MKTKIQIKSYLDKLLFEFKTENNTIKKTLEKVVKLGANLSEAKGLKMYWHIHHNILVENLTEPLENRIDYIKKENSKTETEEQIKLRLKLLKKVKTKILPKTKEGWEKLHQKECKNCSWDGNTIFTKKNKTL